MSVHTLDRPPPRGHKPGRRSLTPLLAVTGAALVFTILLILVRLQWRPLESADHSAATADQRPDRRAPRPGLGGQGGHLAGQRRRAVDDHRGVGGLPGLPAPLAAGRLPAGHRGRRAGPGPDPQVPGRPAAPGGGPPDRARRREQLPQRPLARLDRLLRGGAAGLPARGPRPLADRVHQRDRHARRADRDQPDPARRALPVRRARRLDPGHHLARPDRVRVRADPAGRGPARHRPPGRGTGTRGPHRSRPSAAGDPHEQIDPPPAPAPVSPPASSSPGCSSSASSSASASWS